MEARARRERLAALLLVLAALLLGSWARIDTALRDPNFDVARPEGMLRSDPALLYYFVERIVEAGGLPPEDFRADPRVLHPDATDLPARFTIGQEYLVAWLRLLIGPDPPLHVLCVIVMGAWASLSALGVFLLGLGLSGRALVAGLAALLHALLPATYRTIGFVLVREDFSLPFFALHLGLAALALRRGRGSLGLASGLALGAALVTWHAMRFVAALEVLAVLVVYLRCGANPLRHRAGVLACLGCLAVVLATPVGRASGMALSPPFLGLAALAAGAAASGPAGRSRGRELAAAVAAGAASTMLAWALARSGNGPGEDSHVLGLVAAKLRHLGRLPADPLALDFEVRLMWQGPFETLSLRSLGGELQLLLLGTALVGLVAWAVALLRRPADPALACFALLALLCAPAAWLVARLVILPALIWPALCCAAPLGRFGERRPLAMLLLAALQAPLLLGFLKGHRIGWYLPPERQAELAALLEELPAHVPAGEPVCADFMNSTALLAHLGHPIVLQPKYEDRESRERARAFLEAFYRGSPEQLRRLVLERFRCRFLLIDRYTLWSLGRYLGGLSLAASAPPQESAAERLLSQDPAILTTVPGFTLVHRSPARLRRESGGSTDFYRLFRLEARE